MGPQHHQMELNTSPTTVNPIQMKSGFDHYHSRSKTSPPSTSADLLNSDQQFPLNHSKRLDLKRGVAPLSLSTSAPTSPSSPLFKSHNHLQTPTARQLFAEEEALPHLSPKTPRPSKKDKDPRKFALYKTEMCRSFEETGTCRYGARCQFAHSPKELRNVDRHPKYKTEMCRTFWEKGSCPYGKRCCFIHASKEMIDAKEKQLQVGSLPTGFDIKSPRLRSVSEGFFKTSGEPATFPLTAPSSPALGYQQHGRYASSSATLMSPVASSLDVHAMPFQPSSFSSAVGSLNSGSSIVEDVYSPTTLTSFESSLNSLTSQFDMLSTTGLQGLPLSPASVSSSWETGGSRRILIPHQQKHADLTTTTPPSSPFGLHHFM